MKRPPSDRELPLGNHSRPSTASSTLCVRAASVEVLTDQNGETWLTPEEQSWALGLHSSRRRQQFIAGRTLLRRLLCELHGDASEQRLISAPGAAPRLADDVRLFVSLSHRDDHVVCAVSTAPVGVDVEVIRPRTGAVSDRAELMLSTHEWQSFLMVDSARWPEQLLQRWALKEAWAKMTGLGLGLGDLIGIETEPRAVAESNAATWRHEDLILALVCDDPLAWQTLNCEGPLSDTAAPQTWKVRCDRVTR